MIKLIATDIDGTLIQDSTPDLYPDIVEKIKELTARGLIFCGASGRQYYSIRNVFRDVADQIAYIAENGAHIHYQGEDIRLVPMKRDYAEEIIRHIRKFSECDMVVSTPKGALLESKNKDFLHMMEFGYQNKFRLVEDVLKEDEVILKVAVYRKGSIRELGEAEFIPAWENKVKTCIAGEEWVDFMDESVDKGEAIRFLQEFFGISREETMAFGDSNNDIGMMKAAGKSYAVDTAVPEVKAAATGECEGYRGKGVWKVLTKELG